MFIKEFKERMSGFLYFFLIWTSTLKFKITTMEEVKKKGMSFGKFLLIIIVFIIALIVLQKMGVKVVKTTEKSEMTDHPHPGY